MILTSDHGHVIERASVARSTPGAKSRFRPYVGGDFDEAEVVVEGPRVVAEGESLALLWREDIHHGPRHTGYHGGASLAEVTIPVVVLRRRQIGADAGARGIDDWREAVPAAPEWWNEPARAATTTPQPVREKPRRQATPIVDQPDSPALFQLDDPVTPEPANADDDLVDRVLASSVYADQRARAGRRSADDATVAAVLQALVARDNRAHRDTLAAESGVAAAAVEPMLAAVKRLVNVDGYGVLEQDLDTVTYKLDVTLMREQFEIQG